MRRFILLPALLAGALTLPASAAGPGFKATLHAAGHSPKVLTEWKYSVRVTNPTGHPIWATITSQIVDPLGTKHLVEFDGPGHNPFVKNYRFFGNFCDSVLWPKSSAVGVALKFQTVITTTKGRVVLSYDVTPKS